EEAGFFHPEAPRAVVPKREADVRHPDLGRAFAFPEIRRLHEMAAGKPGLEAFFPDDERGVGRIGEPSVETGAHQSLVVAEIVHRADAEGHDELGAPDRAATGNPYHADRISPAAPAARGSRSHCASSAR